MKTVFFSKNYFGLAKLVIHYWYLPFMHVSTIPETALLSGRFRGGARAPPSGMRKNVKGPH